jgi:hypothetical protein
MAALQITPNDVGKLAVAAGWKGWQVVTAIAVAKAESGHNGYAINVVGTELRADGTPNLAYRSLDVGLWQVNTYWWPSATIKDLLDPTKNAGQAYAIWNGTYTKTAGAYSAKVTAAWDQWAVYEAGMHEAYLPAAVDAARAIGAI